MFNTQTGNTVFNSGKTLSACLTANLHAKRFKNWHKVYFFNIIMYIQNSGD
jgi:hypothetical protein